MLGKAPNLLTLSRIPLAAAFPLAHRDHRGAIVLALAGLSDVLDGWAARRLQQHSEFGQLIDPIADKIFMGAVVATLVANDRLPTWGVFALFTREAFELAATGIALTHPRDDAPRYKPREPTPLGKLTTFAQFAAAASAVLAPKFLSQLLTATGILGFAAGAQYANREFAARSR